MGPNGGHLVYGQADATRRPHAGHRQEARPGRSTIFRRWPPARRSA